MKDHDPRIVALARDHRVCWTIVLKHEIPHPDLQPFRAACLAHGLDTVKPGVIMAGLLGYARDLAGDLLPAEAAALESDSTPSVPAIKALRNRSLRDAGGYTTPLGYAVREMLARRTA